MRAAPAPIPPCRRQSPMRQSPDGDSFREQTNELLFCSLLSPGCPQHQGEGREESENESGSLNTTVETMFIFRQSKGMLAQKYPATPASPGGRQYA